MATAHVPTAPIRYRFMAVEDFEAPEVKSVYVKDMKYSVREGNTKLEGLVTQWTKRGLVKIL